MSANETQTGQLEGGWAPAFFKALCEPSRLAIVRLLLERRCALTVGEIASCCPLDVSVISRHLALLRDAGILDSTRKGKEVLYELKAANVADALRSMAAVFDLTGVHEGS